MAAFTTIAASVGLATTAATTTMSFVQAKEQKKAMQDAEEKAAQRMNDARKKLGVNFLEELTLPLGAYDAEREAMLNASAQAIDAAVQGETRGAGAVAGRVLDANQKGQRQIANQMAEDMYNIKAAQVEEESRLRDLRAQLDLGDVEGAQIAAADAAVAKSKSESDAMKGIVSMVGQAIEFVPLYQQDLAAQKAAVGSMQFDQEQYEKFGNVTGRKGRVSKSMGAAGDVTNGFTNLDFDAIGDMKKRQFRQFKRELSPDQRNMLFMSEEYTDAYQNPFYLNR
tara:strand:- start:3889 stop:4734 length:846 start_codon:yes stop_codon:yes gene_type:complete